jgi:hypothetical protein
MLWWQARKAFRSLKSLQLQKTYIFSTQGLTMSDGLSSAHTSWEAIPLAIETSETLYLYVQQHLFHFIPKRAFSSMEDVATTRCMLAEALGPRATLMK